MKDLHEQLTDLVDAVSIDDANTIRVHGEQQISTSRDVSFDLRDILYHSFYVMPRAVARDHSGVDESRYRKELSLANKASARWDPGWIVYAVDNDGGISAQKGERHRAVKAGLYTSQHRPIQVGTDVSLFIAVESQTIQPYFYHMFGEELSGDFDDHSIVRFYVNCDFESGPQLVEYLSTNLNRYHIPFSFKCITRFSSANRADSAVLYTARRYYPVVARLVADVETSTTISLNPETPLFTKTILPGIGVAEDPGYGQSFGLHRCMATSLGIIDARKAGEGSIESKIRRVRDRFLSVGLSLDQPYLNPGSVDFFENVCPAY